MPEDSTKMVSMATASASSTAVVDGREDDATSEPSTSTREPPAPAARSRLDVDTWVLIVGCAFAIGFTIWLTWGIWQPGIPFGDDNAAHVARTDFALNELFPRLRLDGWQPTYGIGYQEFLFVGPVFTWLAGLLKVITLGRLSNLDAFKAAIVVSYALVPVGVAFLAWAFGLGKRVAGIAAVLSLTISSPLGGAGLASIFETGLVANQIGSVVFCLGLGGMVLILRRPTPPRVALTGVALALVVVSHILTAIVVAFFAVALVISAGCEWFLFHRPGRRRRRRRREESATEDEPDARPDEDESGSIGLRAWPRVKALASAALLAGGLSAFVVVPLIVHGNLRGVSTAFPDVTLSERLPAIWRGDFLFRPWVAAFIAAGITFELVYAMRHRKLSLTLVYTPFVFLIIARLFIMKIPGNIVAQQLTNRAWAFVGFFVVLPLAHLLGWLGGVAVRAVPADRPRPAKVPPSSSSIVHNGVFVAAAIVPMLLAIAIVTVPPKLDRDKARAVAPTPAINDVAETLRQVVPDSGRFVTQRLPSEELRLTGMTHPDLWLAAVTGKSTLNIWNAESSTVWGPVFEAERMMMQPPDEEASTLARWGVTHVVILDTGSALPMLVSPRFRPVWSGGSMRVLEILPKIGQPPPAMLVQAKRPVAASAIHDEPDHYSFSVTTKEAGPVTIGVAWSPKWRVLVNGQPAAFEPSEDRIMQVDVPAGNSEIDLQYGTDVWDLIGRTISLLSIVGLIGWAVRRRMKRRSVPQEA